MILNPSTDKRVQEIAQFFAKNPTIKTGLTWIVKRYNVKQSEALALHHRALTELRSFKSLYYHDDSNWEQEAISPQHHRFIPSNIYKEVNPETYIITKQSKINKQ